MSPVFTNDLDHAVYTRSDDGKSVKLGAHKAGSFSGSAADTLQELVDAGEGVRVLEGEEAKTTLAAQRADTIDPTVTAEGAMPSKVAALVGHVGLLTVSAPLQIVVGDDTAPYGPPTGTTTTKQALATADPSGIDRRQFAENEALISDPQLAEPAVVGAPVVKPPEIHESQRVARETVEGVIDELEIAGAATVGSVTAPDPEDDDDVEPGEGPDDDDAPVEPATPDEIEAMDRQELKAEAEAQQLGLPGNASTETLRSALLEHAAPTGVAVAYASAAALVAAASGDARAALDALDATALEVLRVSAISAIEHHCGQPFTATLEQRLVTGSGGARVNLPARLARIDALEALGTSLSASDVILSGDRSALTLRRISLGSAYMRAMASVDPDITGRHFADGTESIAITGVWGWLETEYPVAVDVALRLDMEDNALADASALSSSVQAYRAMGLKQIRQGNLSADIGSAPGLSLRAQRPLANLVWNEYGAVA